MAKKRRQDPPTASSSSDSEAEGEAVGEEEDQPPASSQTKPSSSSELDYEVKPLASKAEAQTQSGTKRAVENNSIGNNFKRVKKEATDDYEMEAEDDDDDGKNIKQSQRVWSEEDVPVNDITAFYEYLKKSLHFDAIWGNEAEEKKELVETEKVVGDSSLILSEMFRFDKCVGLSGLNEDVVKRGVELIGESEKAELEGRWKKLQLAELELFLKRAQLIDYQARLILEAYKSSHH